MSRMRRKRMGNSIRDNQRKFRTRARTKDLDQIQADMKNPTQFTTNLQDIELVKDLPGMGRFYCIECARHFISQDTLDKHIVTKLHKKRVKNLKVEAFTQKEAEQAVGLKTDNGIRSTSITV